jgi:translation initiation factor IF-2
MNDDNVKGELIKKKDSTPSKKKLVIKKVKKVIIKKAKTKEEELPEQKKITPQKHEIKEQQVTKPKQFQNNYTDQNKKSGQKNYQNKPSDNDKHKKIFFKKNEGDQKFKDKEIPTFNKNFRKDNYNNKQQPSVMPKVGIQKNEKERSRKKINKKNETFINKSEKKEEFQKAFNIRKQKQSEITSSVPSEIEIIDVITISELAKKMNLKAKVIIAKLMELGTMVTINDTIDAATAEIVCSEFNCKVKVVSLYEETVIEEEKELDEDMEHRYPIVTIMGHVDHGKTKLLDAIRSTDVVSQESGGITQHIGAYSVKLPNGEKITFIDTPGHQAFTTMRARGANVTDIVVLVVAADDGVMPQTIEAINHAKAANVPIIVAINKIDKPEANVDRVKQQLSEYDLLPEDWGGHTLYVEISALKKIGIDKLLESILLQAEMLELKASKKVRASGFVLESKIEPGRGVVATILVLKGVLKIGDVFVAGVYAGKVRAMYDDKGNKIDIALPSTPVEITGMEKSPNAGDPFNVTKTEKEAKIISSKRLELKRQEEATSVKKISLKDILSQKQEGEVQELKIIIKADVQGSVEAIKDSLEKLSNKEIKITPIYYNVGAINESDVMLAVASKALIIGFHVRPNAKASELAEKEKIEIKRYNIIYDVIEDIKASMNGMIKPDLIEELLGTAEVRQIFKISKVGTIAGCFITKGKVKRKSLIRLIREDVVIYSGKINTLKRFKDDVDEVLEGMECGIGLENYKDLKEGDILEAYEIKEVSRKIEDIQ